MPAATNKIEVTATVFTRGLEEGRQCEAIREAVEEVLRKHPDIMFTFNVKAKTTERDIRG